MKELEVSGYLKSKEREGSARQTDLDGLSSAVSLRRFHVTFFQLLTCEVGDGATLTGVSKRTWIK